MAVTGNDYLLSSSDQKAIDSLRSQASSGKISWSDANKQANAIRSNYGYSGGSKGSDTNNITDSAKFESAKSNASKSSGSSSSESGSSNKSGGGSSSGGASQNTASNTGGTTTGGTVTTSTAPIGWDEKSWGKYVAGQTDFSTVRDAYAKAGNYTMAAEVDRLRNEYIASKNGGTTNTSTTDATKANGTTNTSSQGTTYNWTKNLYKGIYNSSDVKQLQQALNSLGYKIAVDGNYGTETANAVKQYQKANGLTVDGKTGPQTRTSILNAVNGTKTEDLSGYTLITPEDLANQNQQTPQATQQTPQPTQPVQQATQQTETPLSELSTEEVVEKIYDTIVNNFTDTTEFQNYLTWAESKALAQEMSNPTYDEALKTADEAITKNALSGGWYGQAPTEAARYEAAASIENERNQYINQFAYDIMNNSKDDAIKIMQAKIEAGEFDLDKLITILGLIGSYSADNETDNTDDEVAQQILTTDDSTQKKDNQSDEGSSEILAVYNTVLSGLKNKSLSNDAASKDVTSLYPTLSTSQQRNLVKTLIDNGYDIPINSVAYGANSATVSQVVALQKALKATGAYTGDIDGSYGPATKKAAGNLSAEDAYKKYVSTTKSGASSDQYLGYSTNPVDVTKLSYSPDEGVITWNGKNYSNIPKFVDDLQNTEMSDSAFKAVVNSLISYPDLYNLVMSYANKVNN